MKIRAYQSPWYRICTKALDISKGSYGYGELKNGLPLSVQKRYLPVWSHKLPRFMGGSIGSRMEICENLGLPIPMKPRLHQSNGYIKRKLRLWKAQKCIALVSAEVVLTGAGTQTTPFHGWWYGVGNGNMRKLGPTNPPGTAFAPKQWLYQKEATGMESSKVCCPCWCRNSTYQCGSANYPVSWVAG